MAGRPRALDTNTALPVILGLFWDRGYAGHTLDEIAAAVDVTKPTLYRTLGDKDAMFAAALQEYHRVYIAPAQEQLAQADSLRDGLRGFFSVFVERIVDNDLPPGCFMGDTATTGGFADGPVAETLAALQGSLVGDVLHHVKAAVRRQELAPPTAPMTALQYVLGQVSALAAISHTGPTRKQLDTVVDYMVDGLPWANAIAT